MKILNLLLVILLLVGCSDSSLWKAKAEYVCHNDGGLYGYTRLGDGVAMCQNGKMYEELIAVVIEDSQYYPNKQGKE